MFSEWNILNVKGQQGQKCWHSRNYLSPGEAAITTSSKGTEEGKRQPLGLRKFSWMWTVSVRETKRSSITPVSAEVCTSTACHICLLLAFCLFCLYSAMKQTPTTTQRRTWASIKHDAMAVFKNHTQNVPFHLCWNTTVRFLKKKKKKRDENYELTSIDSNPCTSK